MSVLPIQNVSFTKSKMSVLHNITESQKRHERKRRERKKEVNGFFHKIRPNAEGRIMRPAYHYAGLKNVLWLGDLKASLRIAAEKSKSNSVVYTLVCI